MKKIIGKVWRGDTFPSKIDAVESISKAQNYYLGTVRLIEAPDNK